MLGVYGNQYMNYFARLPNDVVQHDGGLGDFWNLRDKQSFQVAKANNTPGLACMPTVATYATVPRKRYGDLNDKCPQYTQFHPATNCCVTDMTGDGSGSRFMQKLAQAIKRIKNTEVAERIFDQDIVSYLRNRRRVRFADEPGVYDAYALITDGSPVHLLLNEPWLDVFLQFLFRAKPRFDVLTIAGYDQLNHPVGERMVYDNNAAKWHVSEADHRMLHLMRSTGVDGCVVFHPSSNPMVHSAPFDYVRCACLEHGGPGYVDITHAAEFFTSAASGFGGKKDLVFRANGVIAKHTPFYDVVLRIVKSMSAKQSCTFQMGVDDGGMVSSGTHPLDTAFSRILPIHVAFCPYAPRPDIYDVMTDIYDRLHDDLGEGHAPRPSAVSGGHPVGEYYETIYPRRGSKHKYSLKFQFSTPDTGNIFVITKTML